jgi:hypothetical protein
MTGLAPDMDRKTLRSLAWPTLQQPRSKEEAARALALQHHVADDDALEAILGLHREIDAMIAHIDALTSGADPALLKMPTIEPIEEEALKAMWAWANFILSKGG